MRPAGAASTRPGVAKTDTALCGAAVSAALQPNVQARRLHHKFLQGSIDKGGTGPAPTRTDRIGFGIYSASQQESPASLGEGTTTCECWCLVIAASTEAGRPRMA